MPRPSLRLPAFLDRIDPVYLQLMFVMACWGVNIVAMKYLAGKMDVMLVSALRITCAFAAVSVFMFKRFGRIPPIQAGQMAWLMAAGLLVVFVHQATLVWGVRLTSAANTTLIMATSPVMSVFLAALFYRERLTLARLSGAALGIGGVALVIIGSGGQLGYAGLGDALVLIAVLAFVFGGLVIQRVSRSLDPLTILWYTYLVGCVMLVLHVLFSPSTYEAQAWPEGIWPWVLIVFTGVIAAGVCNLLWNTGIAQLGMSRAAMFLNWLPVFGLLAAALFLRERITQMHLVGLVCVLFGTWLGLRRKA